jgi:hypothetical protein
MPPKLTYLLTALLTPIVLLGFALRLLLSPLFLQVEYRMPGFPADEYGFTRADRLQWAPFAVDYLVNNEGISYLGDLRFANGKPLYNERELSHMVDVKRVTKGALNIFYSALAALALLGLWSKRGEPWQAYRQGLKRGGWLMIGLVYSGHSSADSTRCFLRAIRGCSSIRIRSSACSPCASGRIRSSGRQSSRWREGWRLLSASKLPRLLRDSTIVYYVTCATK